MLYPYRILKHDLLNATIEISYFHTLRDAHTACLPDSKNSCCHLMFNGLQKKIANNEDLIKITCYMGIVYWLETLAGKSEPYLLPELPGSKIECECHH